MKINQIFRMISLAAIVITLASISPIAAQSPRPQDTPPLSAPEVAKQDAAIYAKHFKVTQKEAENRLEQQKRISQLNESLARDTENFGGLWLEHNPAFKVHVNFTKAPNDIKKDFPDLEGIVIPKKVDFSWVELRQQQDEIGKKIFDKKIRAEMGIDTKDNAVKIYVEDDITSNDIKTNIIPNLPAHPTGKPRKLEVIKVKQLSRPAVDVYAGLYVSPSGCTSGFSVYNPVNNIRGISTAQHCLMSTPSQSYGGTSTQFQWGYYGGNYDIGWSTNQYVNFRNWMWNGSYNRSITSVYYRSQLYQGQWVFKYGVNTGFTSGTIENTSYGGYWDGRSFSYTFVLANAYTQGGDSGGPVVINNTAIGLVTAYVDWGKLVFMPIDYVDGAGIRIATN